MAKDFFAFLKSYGVIGLAIAVVIGGKLNILVSSLVNDLLMPLIFQPFLRAAHVDDVAKLNFRGIYYGRVLGSAIDFLVVAFVIFLFAKWVLRQEILKK